ncbi:hypothetical protein A3741_23245 [Oleiphilus sp. HI0069]|nr:hypothetical protein A3741_23245 [Oleiphilus sp. HI0069]
MIAAIPLLLVHSVLQTKTNEIVDSFEMAGIKVMNLLSDRSASVPAPAKATQSPSADSGLNAAAAV